MRVFALCEWSLLSGFDRAYWHTIPNMEVVATCLAQRIPRNEWAEVLMGVRVMVKAARPVLNEKKG